MSEAVSPEQKAEQAEKAVKSIEELLLNTSLDATEFLLPWIAILVSVIAALMVKDWTGAIVRGIRFKMSPAFNPGDLVLLEGEEAVIISIGLVRTIFERTENGSTVWRYVPNERLAHLKLEKVVRPS